MFRSSMRDQIEFGRTRSSSAQSMRYHIGAYDGIDTRFSHVALAAQGRFMRPDESEHDCVVDDMSPFDATISCETTPEVGERIVAYLDHVGRIEGYVTECGHSVDFEVEGNEARQIVVLAAATGSQAGGERLSEMTANGVVLGGVSVLFGLLALMPAFGVLMAVIGAVTGFIGRRQANISSNPNGKILSIIGISISIIILLGQVVALLVLSSAFMLI